MPSLPLKSVVADSNVLLAAVARRAAARVLDDSDLIVATTEAAIAEMHDHAEEFADLYKLDLDTLHAAIEVLPVERYSETDYISHIKQAGQMIEHRDPDDVHIVALALKLGVPIWSNDNDFRNLPIALYTTAQLLKLLSI